MAANMNLIVKNCYPRAKQVTDRFHVQKLAYEAVQEIRIKHRWETLDAENTAYKKAKEKGIEYQPEVLANGDTRKQLLTRSRYLLFKSEEKNAAPESFNAKTKESRRQFGGATDIIFFCTDYERFRV
jgi:transposase